MGFGVLGVWGIWGLGLLGFWVFEGRVLRFWVVLQVSESSGVGVARPSSCRSSVIDMKNVCIGTSHLDAAQLLYRFCIEFEVPKARNLGSRLYP